MPRPKKPARLYLRPDTGEWVIRDGGRMLGTGARGDGGRDAAEQALRRHLATRAPERERRGPALPDELTVGEVLADYAREVAPQTAAPERIGYAIKALAPFWGSLRCDAVKGETCRAYARQRQVAPGTVRRELGALQAALNHAHAEGRLIHPVKVALPERPPARDRWLTRDEAARLLRASAPHLRRFILIGLYTGTRSAATLALRWTPSTASGWVDLERGVLHRRGAGERETKKRRRAARLPRQLAAHLRRWARTGGSHVVAYEGEPVARIKRAWGAAVRRAKLDGVTPHSLRHTAITWAMRAGMTIEDAADFFDVSPDTLRAVYWHHSPDYQRRAVEIIEGRKL